MGLTKRLIDALPEKHKKKVAMAALVAGAGVKIYAVHKGAQLYHRYRHYKEGKGIGPGKFAQLSRHRQAAILGYRRSQVRDLERVYDRGRKHHRGFSLF